MLDQTLEAQFPLGMFDGSHYHPQQFELTVGDRLFIISDGVFNAGSSTARYGETALDRFLRPTRNLAREAVRSLLGDLRAFVGNDLADDAVAVYLCPA